MNIDADVADATLLRFSRRAMATTFEIAFPFSAPDAESIAAEALDRIDQLESQLTVYRDSSEVSRLNRIAAQAPVPIAANLYTLLRICQRVSQDTGGAFDITAGPLIKAWGFYRRQGKVPTDAELAYAMARTGMSNLMLEDSPPSVRYLCQGMEINLGSIGKGFALDQVAALELAQRGVHSALLHGGTSSVLAFGSNSWTVGVRSPDGNGRLGTISLRGRAMATSGATYQHFRHQGDTHGHLLDPRTGRPAQGIALAVALAQKAAEADALATAFYVIGVEATREYCNRHQGVAALVVPTDGATVAINLGPDWRPESHTVPAAVK